MGITSVLMTYSIFMFKLTLAILLTILSTILAIFVFGFLIRIIATIINFIRWLTWG